MLTVVMQILGRVQQSCAQSIAVLLLRSITDVGIFTLISNAIQSHW